MLAYRVREHNKTSQTIKKRKAQKIKMKEINNKKKDRYTTLKNVMQEDRKGKAARRTHGLKRQQIGQNTGKGKMPKMEDTGIRLVGRKIRERTSRKKKKKRRNDSKRHYSTVVFVLSPLNSTKNK